MEQPPLSRPIHARCMLSSQGAKKTNSHRSAKSAHRLWTGAKERVMVLHRPALRMGGGFNVYMDPAEHDRPDCSNQHLSLLDVADDSLSCHFKSP